MENSNDTIGNRTRDLPACSAVPQPTAPETFGMLSLNFLVYYIRHDSTCLPTLRDCLSVLLTKVEMKHLAYPETSVHNYANTLRNNTEEVRPHLYRNESL